MMQKKRNMPSHPAHSSALNGCWTCTDSQVSTLQAAISTSDDPLRGRMRCSMRMPSQARICFKLLLSSLHKGRVVSLGDFYTAMPQEKRHLIERDTGQQQFNREGVPEHMGITALWLAVV